MLEYLGRLFCRCDNPHRSQDMGGAEGGNYRGHRRLTQYGHSLTVVDNEGVDEQVPIIALNGSISSGIGPETSSMGNTAFHAGVAGPERGNGFTFKPRSASGRRRKYSGDGREMKVDYSRDWQALAEIVDRLFFWTFLLAIIAISLLLFHPLTKHTMYPERMY